LLSAKKLRGSNLAVPRVHEGTNNRKFLELDPTGAELQKSPPTVGTRLVVYMRNVLPLVAPAGHCIAPALIGFGRSGKPDIEYRLADHVRYVDAFLDNAGISSAFVIAQDWGTALAFHLAARRPEFIRGIAFMEFIRPVPT